jgi:hypothetical protein
MRGRGVVHVVLSRMRRRSRASGFRQFSVKFKKALQRVWLLRKLQLPCRKRHKYNACSTPYMDCPNCGKAILPMPAAQCPSCTQALRIFWENGVERVVPVVPLCVWIETRPEVCGVPRNIVFTSESAVLSLCVGSFAGQDGLRRRGQPNRQRDDHVREGRPPHTSVRFPAKGGAAMSNAVVVAPSFCCRSQVSCSRSPASLLRAYSRGSRASI